MTSTQYNLVLARLVRLCIHHVHVLLHMTCSVALPSHVLCNVLNGHKMFTQALFCFPPQDPVQVVLFVLLNVSSTAALSSALKDSLPNEAKQNV